MERDGEDALVGFENADMLGIDRDLDKLADSGFGQNHVKVAVEIRDHTELEVARQVAQDATAEIESHFRLVDKGGADAVGKFVAGVGVASQMATEPLRAFAMQMVELMMHEVSYEFSEGVAMDGVVRTVRGPGSMGVGGVEFRPAEVDSIGAVMLQEAIKPVAGMGKGAAKIEENRTHRMTTSNKFSSRPASSKGEAIKRELTGAAPPRHGTRRQTGRSAV